MSDPGPPSAVLFPDCLYSRRRSAVGATVLGEAMEVLVLEMRIPHTRAQEPAARTAGAAGVRGGGEWEGFCAWNEEAGVCLALRFVHCLRGPVL